MIKRLIITSVVISCLTLSGCVEVHNSNQTSDPKISVEDELASNSAESTYTYVTYEVSDTRTTEEINYKENYLEKEGSTLVEDNRFVDSANPASASAEKLYRVQAGVFSMEENALALEKDIKDQGIETAVVEKDGFYVLYVGGFRVKENAYNRLAELQSLGFEGLIKFE